VIAGIVAVSGRTASAALIDAFRRKRSELAGFFPLPVQGVEIVTDTGAPTAWFQALARKAGLTLAQDAPIVDAQGKPTAQFVERWQGWS